MLLLTPSGSGLFKWRQLEPEGILLAVGWYLRFSLYMYQNTIISKSSNTCFIAFFRCTKSFYCSPRWVIDRMPNCDDDKSKSD